MYTEESFGPSALEIKLFYRCLPDFRLYVESAIYFVNEKDQIVSGIDNSIDKEYAIYLRKKLIEKIKRSVEWVDMPYPFGFTDELHLIRPEK